MTPVSKSLPRNGAVHSPGGTGNSAVFRLRSSRIGRNDRAASQRTDGRTDGRPRRRSVCMRVYFDRTKRISFLAFMAPARALFPHLTRRFVSRSARPEKIYRRARTVARPPNSGKRSSPSRRRRGEEAFARRRPRARGKRARARKTALLVLHNVLARTRKERPAVNFARNNVVSLEVIPQYTLCERCVIIRVFGSRVVVPRTIKSASDAGAERDSTRLLTSMGWLELRAVTPSVLDPSRPSDLSREFSTLFTILRRDPRFACFIRERGPRRRDSRSPMCTRPTGFERF